LSVAFIRRCAGHHDSRAVLLFQTATTMHSVRGNCTEYRVLLLSPRHTHIRIENLHPLGQTATAAVLITAIKET